MNLPTQAQIDVIKRYAINAVTSVMGFAGVAALLARYGVDSKGLIDLINGLGVIVTGLIALAGTVGTVWTTLRGFRAAAPTNQVASLKQTMASTSTSTETKQAVLAGAVDTVSVAAHEAEPEVKTAAKVALLDATGGLAEVVRPIEVDDRNLADKTGSDVKLAAA